ncbi:2OG-Fe(II) oxygenase family protein [Caulobacter segnis]|uniref:2OG-Fe(II) oxygenase n=1 Tax=Caulobacter segnis TaxID=88688 RepID=UPI00285BE62E|nr:2OG-Fe(II) oxygenase family protein [Caulobacter segnis]MDR6627837.1 SM-20-related protein [Caulobacter segnis]
MDDAPILRLNPALDPAAFAATYSREGVARIPDVFEPAVVDRLAGILEQTIDWDIICSDERGKADVMDRARRQALGSDAVAGRLHAATARARDGFAYVYLGYPMIDAYLAGRDPGHPIHALTKFLNSQAFIGFCSAVTGETTVGKIDGQATCYRPGDFLTLRDDTGEGERLAAYALGLTRTWRPHWGGQLLFHDAQGDVERGYAPTFNTLTLFRAPRAHSVAPVAPYAGAARLTITGWLRNDPPHGGG